MTTIGSPATTLDEALCARIEDAGINASAPRQQRWVDGWLVRLSPGKAKRARCIQAVAPGRLGIDEKLALCLPLFAAEGLRPYLRITPFSEPQGLDGHLAALGMERIDDTRVMAVASLNGFTADDTRASATRLERADPGELAEWLGAARGSSATERRAHADRIAQAVVPHHSVLARDAQGELVAAGQVAIEGAVAGLYDIFTADSARGRGHGESVCRQLLAFAVSAGARVGYLQVDAANEPALRIYRRLGFIDAYSYHYRTPPLPAP